MIKTIQKTVIFLFTDMKKDDNVQMSNSKHLAQKCPEAKKENTSIYTSQVGEKKPDMTLDGKRCSPKLCQ